MNCNGLDGSFGHSFSSYEIGIFILLSIEPPTLPKCKGLCFHFCSNGFVYLVLSRLKTLEGLSLIGFLPLWRVHVMAIHFFEKFDKNRIMDSMNFKLEIELVF